MHWDGDRDATCRGIKVLILHVSPKTHLFCVHPHFRAHHASLFPNSQITEHI